MFAVHAHGKSQTKMCQMHTCVHIDYDIDLHMCIDSVTYYIKQCMWLHEFVVLSWKVGSRQHDCSICDDMEEIKWMEK